MSEQIAASLLFKGTPTLVCPEPTPFGFGRILLDEQKLRVKIPSTIAADRHHDYCHQQVLGWLKAQARTTLNTEVFQLCSELGLKYRNIAIKDTRSRWGSCSGKTNLNFNWRLIMAPAEVLQYVVVHETAHLQEMNHSARFWALVQQRCPDFHRHRDWLKKHGAEILQWQLKLDLKVKKPE